MNIIITNYHLAKRAGSELYCLELALALKRNGHKVGLFTIIPGAISDEAKLHGISIFTKQDKEAILKFKPDILHLHHNSCWSFLKEFLCVPIIFSSLGRGPGEETPPEDYAGISLGLAVSEETLLVMRETSFGQNVPIKIFRNWFDDSIEIPVSKLDQNIYNVAVITNHLDENLCSNLDILKRSSKFKWTHFGMPENSIEITPKLLNNFNRVITIGRTVMLSAAMGIPCLIYDIYGCDGYLNIDNITELATKNCAGRLYHRQPSLQELQYLLFSEVKQLNLDALRQEIRSQWSLSYRVKQIEDYYELAIDNHNKTQGIDKSVLACYNF